MNDKKSIRSEWGRAGSNWNVLQILTHCVTSPKYVYATESLNSLSTDNNTWQDNVGVII